MAVPVIMYYTDSKSVCQHGFGPFEQKTIFYLVKKDGKKFLKKQCKKRNYML